MKVIFGLRQIKRFRRPVVALGVFDGVHLGHREILKGIVKEARRINGTSTVLTFWPHPQREESLYSLKHRLRLIARLGVAVCIVINFNPNFAKMKARDFVKNILFKRIRANYIYVGKNFRFGKNAQGNFKTLEELSKVYHFRLKGFKVIRINNRPISSTSIRTLIKKGRLATARRLLSLPVTVLGTVIRGSSLARFLGFPTANINPHHEILPPSGVYAVKVILGNRKLNAVCYIGTKPTFKARKQAGHKSKEHEKHIEVYIFNFKRNIYGKYLEIQFIRRIREEKKFSSVPALVAQVKKDIRLTQRIFSPH